MTENEQEPRDRPAVPCGPRVRRALALAAAALSVAWVACVAYSTHPIRGDPPFRFDPELGGSWRSTHRGKPSDEADAVLTFTSHGDHYVTTDPGHELDVFEVTTARLGGQSYLNALQVGPDGPNVYMLMRYRIEGDRLWLAMMDDAAAARAVKRGELAVADHDPAVGESDLLLTSSTAQLEEFLLAHDPAELFPIP
jgi:hypothetical protein